MQYNSITQNPTSCPWGESPSKPNCITRTFARIRRSKPYITFARGANVPVAFVRGTIDLFRSKVFLTPFKNKNQTDFFTAATVITLTGVGKIATGAVNGCIAFYDIGAQPVEIYDEMKKTKMGGQRKDEKIEAWLRFICALALMTTAVAIVALGISAVSDIDASAWANKALLVGASVGSLQIALQVHLIRVTKKELKKIDNNGLQYLEDLKKVLLDSRTNDGDYVLKRKFDIIDRETYKEKILNIINGENQGERQILLDALKERLKDKASLFRSHKLEILDILITLAATALFLFTAVNPLNILIISGVGGLISYYKSYKDWRSVSNLEKTIQDVPEPQAYTNAVDLMGAQHESSFNDEPTHS